MWIFFRVSVSASVSVLCVVVCACRPTLRAAVRLSHSEHTHIHIHTQTVSITHTVSPCGRNPSVTSLPPLSPSFLPIAIQLCRSRHSLFSFLLSFGRPDPPSFHQSLDILFRPSLAPVGSLLTYWTHPSAPSLHHTTKLSWFLFLSPSLSLFLSLSAC